MTAVRAAFILVLAGVALAACGGQPASEEASVAEDVEIERAPPDDALAITPEDAARIAALSARLDALEAEIRHAEDVSAIKRLMRTYGYYLDRGLWEDLADLFTEDGVGGYPAGVYIGRESLRPHFLENNGRGHVGLEEGRLGNHIVLQPVITVDPGGETAHGRWRVLAQLGQHGERASWAGGIYEIDYRKEEGVWKISELEYFGTFGAPYERGWIPAPPRAPGEAPAEPPRRAIFADLPRPPDEPSRAGECPPDSCIPPFHYDNPASGRPFDPQEWVREAGE